MCYLGSCEVAGWRGCSEPLWPGPGEEGGGVEEKVVISPVHSPFHTKRILLQEFVLLLFNIFIVKKTGFQQLQKVFIFGYNCI